MAELKFTQGEWKVSGQYSNIRYVEADDKILVTVWDFPEMEANAHLIASAPDMYEALKWLVNRCTEIMIGYNQGLTLDKVNWTEIVGESDRRARIALAKAEGK